MKKRILIFSLIFFFCVAVFGATIVKAEEKKEDDKTEEKAKKKDVCATYGKDTDEYYLCLNDRKASVKTSSFIASALYSLDSVISGKEIAGKPDYIKNFSNSSQTAIAYDIDILDPQTILMHIVGLIIVIIESIGSMITLLVMVLFNASSSSFWQTTMRGIFDIVDNLIFDWSNPNSIFMKFVLLFGLIAIAQKMLKSFKRVFGFKEIMMIVLSTVLSMTLVIGIAKYGKPIMDKVENMSNSFITETISTVTNGISNQTFTEEKEYEIATKDMIFEVMQAQGFRLRHFGVTATNQIKEPSTEYGGGDFLESLSGSVKAEQQKAKEEWNKNKSQSQKDRYEVMLNDPSKDNAQNERKIYGSTDVIYNFGQSVAVLILSVIFLVHKLLIGLVIAIGCLLVLTISILKEVLLSVSIYALIKCILTSDKRSALSWFFNRFQWLLLAAGSKFVLSLLIFIIISAVNAIGGASFGLIIILPFDAVLLVGMIYVLKNAPMLLQKVLATLDADGVGVVGSLGKFVAGNGTPKELFKRAQDKFGSSSKESESDSKDGGDDEESTATTEESSLSNVKDDYANESAESALEKVEEGANEEASSANDVTNNNEEVEEEFDINKEFEKTLEEKENQSIENDEEVGDSDDIEEQSSIDDVADEDSNENVEKEQVKKKLTNSEKHEHEEKSSLNDIDGDVVPVTGTNEQEELEKSTFDEKDKKELDDFYHQLLKDNEIEDVLDEDTEDYL